MMMYTHIFEDETLFENIIVIATPNYEDGCHDDFEINKNVFFKMMFVFKNGHTEYDREYETVGSDCIRYTKLHVTVDGNIVRFKKVDSFNTVSYSFEDECQVNMKDLMEFTNRYALTH